MSRLVKRRLVNIGKIGSKVRHVKCAGYGSIDRAVIAGAMPLGDQPDLLDAPGPGLCPQKRVDRALDRHASGQADVDDLPGSVVGGDPTQGVVHELPVNLESARTAGHDDGSRASGERIYDGAARRRCGFDEELGQTDRKSVV